MSGDFALSRTSARTPLNRLSLCPLTTCTPTALLSQTTLYALQRHRGTAIFARPPPGGGFGVTERLQRISGLQYYPGPCGNPAACDGRRPLNLGQCAVSLPRSRCCVSLLVGMVAPAPYQTPTAAPPISAPIRCPINLRQLQSDSRSGETRGTTTLTFSPGLLKRLGGGAPRRSSISAT
jgi:hypothetical protein